MNLETSSRMYLLLRQCGLVAILSVIAFWCGYRGTSTNSESNRLHVNSQDLAIVVDSHQDEILHSFAVTNQSSETVSVEAVELSCSCTSVEPNHFVLQPGEEITLRTAIDLSSKRLMSNDVPESHVQINLRPVVANGASLEKPWSFHINVQNPYYLSQSALHFVGHGHCAPFNPKSLQAIWVAPAGDISSVAMPPCVSVDVERAAGREDVFEIAVTPHDDLSVGRHEAVVRLLATDGNGRSLPVVELPVHIDVKPTIHLLPSILQVSRSDPHRGAQVEHLIQLTGHANEDFSVIATSVSSLRGDLKVGIELPDTASRDGKLQAMLSLGEIPEHICISKVIFDIRSTCSGRFSLPLLITCTD